MLGGCLAPAPRTPLICLRLLPGAFNVLGLPPQKRPKLGDLNADLGGHVLSERGVIKGQPLMDTSARGKRRRQMAGALFRRLAHGICDECFLTHTTTLKRAQSAPKTGGRNTALIGKVV